MDERPCVMKNVVLHGFFLPVICWHKSSFRPLFGIYFISFVTMTKSNNQQVDSMWPCLYTLNNNNNNNNKYFI